LDANGAPFELVSQTACFPGGLPAEDLIPYTVRSPLWSDGSVKDRFLVLPPGSAIDFVDNGVWGWPAGAVLVKNFSLELASGDIALVETRFMLVDAEQRWTFVSYEWNDDGDAQRISKFHSRTLDVAGGTTLRYDFPDEQGCRACHGQFALGPRTDQMNYGVSYDGELLNQLEALASIGVFAQSDVPDPAQLPALPLPADATAPIDQRARSYLHGNCAHCHRPGGWAPPNMDMDLRITTPFEDARLCGVPRQFDTVYAGDYRIAPGDLSESAVFNRMLLLDLGRMAPLGTNAIDPLVEPTVGAWIGGLDGCP
jgi:hypothetical protein